MTSVDAFQCKLCDGLATELSPACDCTRWADLISRNGESLERMDELRSGFVEFLSAQRMAERDRVLAAITEACVWTQHLAHEQAEIDGFELAELIAELRKGP